MTTLHRVYRTRAGEPAPVAGDDRRAAHVGDYPDAEAAEAAAIRMLAQDFGVPQHAYVEVVEFNDDPYSPAYANVSGPTEVQP